MNSKNAVHLFCVYSGKSNSEALTALACALPLALTIPCVIYTQGSQFSAVRAKLLTSLEDCVLTVLHCTFLLNLCTERGSLYRTTFLTFFIQQQNTMGALYINNFRSNQKLIPMNAHYTQTVLHHYNIRKARPKDALHRTSKQLIQNDIIQFLINSSLLI